MRILVLFAVSLLAQLATSARRPCRRCRRARNPRLQPRTAASSPSRNMASRTGRAFPMPTAITSTPTDDSFLKGTPIRVRLDDENATLDAARLQARQKGEAIVSQAELTANRGITAGFNPVTELSADPHRMVVNPRPIFSPVDQPLEFRLDEIGMNNTEGCESQGEINGFRLLRIEAQDGGQTQLLHEDKSIPQKPRLPERLPDRRGADLFDGQPQRLCGADRGAPIRLRRAGLSLDRGDRPPVTPLAQPARRNRALNRVRRAVPSPRTALFGALLWAVAMGASALVNLLLDDWETPAKIRFVVAALCRRRRTRLSGWPVRGAAGLARAALGSRLRRRLRLPARRDDRLHRRAVCAAIPLLLCRMACAGLHHHLGLPVRVHDADGALPVRRAGHPALFSARFHRACLPPASGLRGSSVEHFARLC